MNTFKINSFMSNFFLLIVFVLGIGFSATASAVSINFDTMQDGTPYTGLGGSFPSNEYNGVVINDSDPATGITYVNEIHPDNVGTAISGYYVNVGAFDGTPQTELTFDFTTVVTDVSFDFATPSGDLTVTALDVTGATLGVYNLMGLDPFTNQAGFPYGAGHVDISGIGEIASIIVHPDLNQALIVDNLNFSPVPIPAAAWLFGSGFISLIGAARRRKA